MVILFLCVWVFVKVLTCEGWWVSFWALVGGLVIVALVVLGAVLVTAPT